MNKTTVPQGSASNTNFKRVDWQFLADLSKENHEIAAKIVEFLVYARIGDWTEEGGVKIPIVIWGYTYTSVISGGVLSFNFSSGLVACWVDGKLELFYNDPFIFIRPGDIKRTTYVIEEVNGDLEPHIITINGVTPSGTTQVINKRRRFKLVYDPTTDGDSIPPVIYLKDVGNTNTPIVGSLGEYGTITRVGKKVTIFFSGANNPPTTGFNLPSDVFYPSLTKKFMAVVPFIDENDVRTTVIIENLAPTDPSYFNYQLPIDVFGGVVHGQLSYEVED